MRICVVNYESTTSWILSSLATHLEQELRSLGSEVSIADHPDPTADVNYHIIYAQYSGRPSSIDTLMITHIDTAAKVSQLEQQLRTAAMGVCLSSDTMHKLVALGLPRERLCYINFPSPQQGRIERRRTTIGLTSRCHPHGSKREYLLGELARRLPSGEFVCHIMGLGWDAVIEELRRHGTEVVYYGDFEQEAYRRLWQGLDYYLYLGQDEGSTGLLDALEAGVPTITTPQGFHLDLEGGVVHVVEDLDDLTRVFGELAEERGRLRASVAHITWPEYARKHLALWGELINRRAGRVVHPVDQACLDAMELRLEAEPSNPVRGRVAAMPLEPGPGGAVHRPRLLVVADEPLDQVETAWRQIIAASGDSADITLRCEGQGLEQRAYLVGFRLDVKLVDWRSRSIEELAVLSLDFDAVGFWNFAPLQAFARLNQRWRPNYLMRSSFLSRLNEALSERPGIARWGSRALFGFVHALGTTSRVKIISFWTQPPLQSGPDLSGRHELRTWLSSVDAVIYAGPDRNALVETSAPRACRVPSPGASPNDGGWGPAIRMVLETIAAPRGAERPAWLFYAVKAAQSVMIRARGIKTWSDSCRRR